MHAAPYIRTVRNRLLQSPFYSCYATPDAVYGLYNRRLYPWDLGDDSTHAYRTLCDDAVLYDVPETPLEIVGPDATALLDRVLTRNVGKLRIGRAAYGLACLPNGGVLMDGVVMRLDTDRYWYVQADGDFFGWLQAQAERFNVEVRDPQAWALQVQGPKSLDVLEAACDGPAPSPFKYFAVARCVIAGQPLIVSRTGWTGEIGFELFTTRCDVDGPALWQRLLETGKAFNLAASGVKSMGIRRIEAGILDYGSDISVHDTPFDVRMEDFVDFAKKEFIGRAALVEASREPRLHGFRCADGVALRGSAVRSDGRPVGRVTSSAWSPTLQCGIGYWRADEPKSWHRRPITVAVTDGQEVPAMVAEFPFYDAQKKLPRGLTTRESLTIS